MKPEEIRHCALTRALRLAVRTKNGDRVLSANAALEWAGTVAELDAELGETLQGQVATFDQSFTVDLAIRLVDELLAKRKQGAQTVRP